MQDRYVGDVGDFVKYGLLRAIRGNKRLGVAWYLHPDAGPPGDGRHTAYLKHPDEWRDLDEELFDKLRQLICDRRHRLPCPNSDSSSRTVARIQSSGILGDAVFAADRLVVADVKVRKRALWRHNWFAGIKHQLADCNLVFADPDNGLVPNDRFKPTWKVSAKGIPLAEAMELAAGRTAVIYHHNSRRRGGHRDEIRWWKDQFPDGTMAYYWRLVSNRTFFVINPDDDIRRQLREFEKLWGNRGELL